MTRTERILKRIGLGQLPPALRKLLIGVIGTTIVLLGLVLIFLPGPGALVILIGLGVLATEFVWARSVIRRGRTLVKKVGQTVKRR